VQIVMEPESTPDKRATAALRADGVDRLTLRNIDVRWAAGKGEPGWTSALELARVKELTLDGVVGRPGQAGAAVPAVVLDEVDGASVRACRALPGTGLFLSVRGASSRGVRLFANDFSEATRAYVVGGDAPDDAVTEPAPPPPGR
jgi:hypothetical protein